MMRFGLLGAVVALFLSTAPSSARVDVRIDLSSQRMLVRSSGGEWVWPISSGRSGFGTPGGSYAPTGLERMHYSRKYGMAPMPYAIFFRGGYAIHGTGETGALGRPASHGCVRLSTGHAAALFAMVQREGARIAISGAPPASATYAAREPRPASYRSLRAVDAPARHYGYARPTYGEPVYYPGGGWQYVVPYGAGTAVYGTVPYGY